MDLSESQELFRVLKSVSENPKCVGCPMLKVDYIYEKDKKPVRFVGANNKFVPPTYGTGTRLTIGSAPTDEESAEGWVFQGWNGNWVEGMLRKAGVDRKTLTMTNVLSCACPQNIFPTDAQAKYISYEDGQKAVQHCYNAHLKPLIEAGNWTRIDVLGEEALNAVVGETDILYWRGSPLAAKGEEKVRVVPTLDAKYIMRDQSMIPIMVNDLKKNTQVPPEYYNLDPSIPELQEFVATEFAFDIETNPATKEISMVGLCDRPYHVIVVPFRGAYITELRRIFAAAKTVYGQNILAFDLPILEDNGILTSDECHLWDIMLLHHLLFPQFSGEAKVEGNDDPARKGAGGHGLEFIASQFTNKPAWKEVGRGGLGYWERRNAIDSDVTFQAGRTLIAMIKQNKLLDLYNYVQHPLALICKQMQDIGIKRDPKRLAEVREKLLAEVAAGELLLPETIRAYDKPKRKKIPAPDGTLNEKGKPVKFLWEETTERISPWRSPQKLQAYFYTELGLPAQKSPKTKKVTTDKGAIEKCIKILRREKRHELVPGIIAYQKVKKAATLLSGFCKEDMEGAVSRAHPRFNVIGTSGGRLSSADPNFQNQPEKARYMYVPSHADWSFVEVDYSNIEPRLTAYFANDEARLRRFAEPGYNDHKYTTSIFFDIPYDQVVKDNDKDAPYGKAKRINNGLNYGMGAMKIANTFDLEFKEVKELVFKWKQLNAQTERWQQATAEEAKKVGWLTTPFGRKRWFYTNTYYTESLSFLPQSSAADILFRAMIGLMFERIKWPYEKVSKIVRIIEPLPQPWRLILSVHDSLVFEGPTATIPDAVATIKRVCEQSWPELGGTVIPIDVKVSSESWGECSSYKPPVLAIAA